MNLKKVNEKIADYVRKNSLEIGLDSYEGLTLLENTRLVEISVKTEADGNIEEFENRYPIIELNFLIKGKPVKIFTIISDMFGGDVSDVEALDFFSNKAGMYTEDSKYSFAWIEHSGLDYWGELLEVDEGSARVFFENLHKGFREELDNWFKDVYEKFFAEKIKIYSDLMGNAVTVEVEINNRYVPIFKFINEELGINDKLRMDAGVFEVIFREFAF